MIRKGKLTPIAGIAIVALVIVSLSLITFPWHKRGAFAPWEAPPEAEFEEQQCEYLKYELDNTRQPTDAPNITWTGQDCVREFTEDQIIEHLEIINGEWEWVEK
tara:strand:+ start:2386 stop:2697 length:312 start_codon:yes stop_codon:yes gene_type:complete